MKEFLEKYDITEKQFYGREEIGYLDLSRFPLKNLTITI